MMVEPTDEMLQCCIITHITTALSSNIPTLPHEFHSTFATMYTRAYFRPHDWAMFRKMMDGIPVMADYLLLADASMSRLTSSLVSFYTITSEIDWSVPSRGATDLMSTQDALREFEAWDAKSTCKKN